jgi:hypothetical protein
VQELADGRARVRHANGSVELVEPCAHEPRVSRDAATARRRRARAREQAPALFPAQLSESAPAPLPLPPAPANTPCHEYPPPSTCPATWEGWLKHWWFGLWWAPFTRPPLPANETIYSLNATWLVPALPLDLSGNESDPWYQSEPTESWWTGLQGGAVLQPVMELNGLVPRSYDAVSWMCCQAGMAWYSFPLIALPGETVVGEIVRVSGEEVGAQDSLYVYLTVTGVRSAARGYSETRLFSAMTEGDAGWVPDWAEVVQESYFVTSCARLPCGAGAFADLAVATAQKGLPFNETTPSAAAPQWAVSYEAENDADPGAPVCGGNASFSAAAATAAVTFDCELPH